MHPTLTGPAIVYTYDVRQILLALEPALVDWMAFRGFDRQLNEAELVDLWFATTIHHFDIVSVKDFTETGFPSEVINALREPVYPIHLLWDMLWFPPEVSGTQVILRRLRDTLWIVFIDPRKLTPVPNRL